LCLNPFVESCTSNDLPGTTFFWNCFSICSITLCTFFVLLMARLLSSVVSFPHMHYPKYRVTINDWYIFGDKIRGNYKAFPYMTGVSGKSYSQRYQNWRHISIFIFTSGSAIMGYDSSHREEILCDWVHENKFMHQCSAGRVISVGLCKGTSVWATCTTGYWWI
jgi:hypothetical protein